MNKGNFTKESTSTTGAVLTLTLAEITGWARLSAVSSIAIGDTFEYVIFNGNNKEVGIGTKQASNTLDRTTPIATLDAGVYDDSSPVKLTLVGDSEVFVSLSAENTLDINDTKFNKALYRVSATLNGNAIDGHVNLGSGVSITGTVGQSYDFITIGGGFGNTAKREYSTISGGINNSIDRENSFIGGGTGNLLQTNAYDCVIGGGNGNIMGTNPLRSGILGGFNNSITGSYSFIGGGWIHSITSSYGAIAGGHTNTINANYGYIAGGRGCKVPHTHAGAFGGGSESRANFDLVLGATDTITSSTANNTIRFQATGGNILIDGAVSSPEADTAECFEYSDANPADENRNGFFVSLIEGKLILGGTNIKGIISAAPSLISNAAPNNWQGMYLKDKYKKRLKTDYTLVEWVDEWGDDQYVYESANQTLFDEYPQPTAVNGRPSSKVPIGNLKKTIVSVPTINPAFDITQVDSYKSRVDRKEWGVTGVTGQIIVNTSEPITGWFVDADIDNPGYAKNGSTYDVIEVIDDFTALVYFK